jgi:hypothetical protein
MSSIHKNIVSKLNDATYYLVHGNTWLLTYLIYEYRWLDEYLGDWNILWLRWMHDIEFLSVWILVRLSDWLVGSLDCCLTDWVPGWLSGPCLIDWLGWWMTDRLVYLRIFVRLNNWKTRWNIVWLTGWLDGYPLDGCWSRYQSSVFHVFPVHVIRVIRSHSWLYRHKLAWIFNWKRFKTK